MHLHPVTVALPVNAVADDASCSSAAGVEASARVWADGTCQGVAVAVILLVKLAVALELEST